MSDVRIINQILNYIHRYTKKWICAVPCDNVDDLCEDLLDEDCKISSVNFTLTLLIVLLLVTVFLGESVFVIERPVQESEKENDNSLLKLLHLELTKNEVFSEFSQIHRNQLFYRTIETTVRYIVEHENENLNKSEMSKTIFKLELAYHNGNKGDTFICLKQSLGTNETSQSYFNLISSETFFKRLFSCFKNSWLTMFQMVSKWLLQTITPNQLQILVRAKIILFHLFFAIGIIILHFLDFIKVSISSAFY